MPSYGRVLAAALCLSPLGFRQGLAQSVGADRSVHMMGEPSLAPPVETPTAGQNAHAVLTLPQNPAQKSSGVRIEVLPAREFDLGQNMVFRVTAEKPGYLMLIDVDSTGKVAQIYPNVITLADPKGVDEKANYLKAGQSISLPSADAGFKFLALPPTGVGMVVAILSETPVQVIDLPDVPMELAGQWKAAEFLQQTTRMLQIVSGEGTRRAGAPKWAFATAFYGIR